MMHIPLLIEKFGPLRNVWCMNYEAKHQYFKKLIVNTRNFINVTHTLAERHQMKLAHALASTQFFSRGSEPHSVIKEIKFDRLPQTLKLTIQEKIGKSVKGGTLISTVRSLQSDGLIYTIH